MSRLLLIALMSLWLAWYLAFSVDLAIPADIHPGDTTLWFGEEDTASTP